MNDNGDSKSKKRGSSAIAAAERNAMATMWAFIKNNGYSGGGDDDDDSNALSMSSTEKREMAIPPSDITVEDSLSAELMGLSMNDRTAIEEEIHGVRCLNLADTETPELLVRSLHEFDKELMIVKTSERRRRKRARINPIRNGGRPINGDVLRNVIRISPDETTTATATATATATMPPRANRNSTTASSISSSYSNSEAEAEDSKKRSCYVNDPDVRLRFLRCENFDIKKAVIRFVNFLEFAQELYGDFVADRPIRLSDLNSRQEKRALANMHFQFLPFRDRSGRRVFVAVGTCGYDVDTKMRCKIFFYMYWVISEDIESQQKGVVIVAWPSDVIINNSNNNGGGGHNNSEEDNKSTSDGSVVGVEEKSTWERSLRPSIVNLEGVYTQKGLNGLPMRIAALHFCFENKPIYKIVNSLFYFAMDSNLKARYKVHVGKLRK